VQQNIDLKIQQSRESARVNIPKKAREFQRIAELVRTGNELRSQKVKQIKERVSKGDYNVDAQEVSKSIIRSEVSRILEKK
jgi:flagellar biosynthesis anti-sigma factor FlgM